MTRVDDIGARPCWFLRDPPDLGEPTLRSVIRPGRLRAGHTPIDIRMPESGTFSSTVDGARFVVGEEPSREDLRLLCPQGGSFRSRSTARWSSRGRS